MINFRKAHQHLIFLLILNVASKVGGECSCGDANEDGDRNKSLALKYKMVAIASILLAGAIGVCFPLLGKSIKALRPEKEFFFLIKAFAAGVILSTGFIHVLPDATESLTAPSLDEKPWGKFPFAGLVAMTSAIATLMVDTLATSHFTKSQTQQGVGGGDEEKIGEHENNIPVHTHATHGHAHGSASFLENSQLVRHRVVSQVLELGIVVHSVIIGMSLGASESPKTIKPLVAALTFHQFFEGMGLGGCISQAKFKSATVAIMAMFFSLTTPVGIAIGIAITKIYDEDSPKALIVEGILNAASAGILIYMALVDLLANDFMNQKVQTNVKLQIGTCLSLILGAALMSLLAIWA